MLSRRWLARLVRHSHFQRMLTSYQSAPPGSSVKETERVPSFAGVGDSLMTASPRPLSLVTVTCSGCFGRKAGAKDSKGRLLVPSHCGRQTTPLMNVGWLAPLGSPGNAPCPCSHQTLLPWILITSLSSMKALILMLLGA